MNLTSYDRVFPSQDVLPDGGFGSLLAAPLQGQCRRTGTTVFLDLATMEPHEDQWAYLSTVDRLTPRELTRSLGRLREPVVGTEVRSAITTSATRIHVPAPAVVRATIGSRVTIGANDLIPATLATLRHAASLRNPAFDERQRLRRSTRDTPRYLRSYDETLAGDLVVPRGLLQLVTTLIGEQGSRVELTDERVDAESIALDFAGTLRPDQSAALDALCEHDLGVLVAPPGAGKTVVACAAIARVGRPTLVLVDRKALADQWRTQIQALLGIKAGQLGGGRTTWGDVVDVATLQTLSRRADVAHITSRYGFVVVDECHHIPAAAFEDVVRQVASRRWLGLTATPYRRDRLEGLIDLQIGPVRHTMTSTTTPVGQLAISGVAPAFERRLLVHHTALRYTGDRDPYQPGGISAVDRSLVDDVPRLGQVVNDVIEAYHRGRSCLVLTQWKRHVEHIASALVERGRDPAILVGGMGSRARAAAAARLEAGSESGPLLVIATGPCVGEGLDCPSLDTLFLAAPIAFSGRLVQYVGRVLRPWPGKEIAAVHDYVDVHVPILASSLTKRARGNTSLGFPDPRTSAPIRSART